MRENGCGIEIGRFSGDPDWLDTTMRIVEKQIQKMNFKQKGRAEAGIDVSEVREPILRRNGNLCSDPA